MASCYHCARSGADYRREVTTGYSKGSWSSKRSFGSSSRTSYGLRTVCERCAASIDKGRAKRTAIYLMLLAVVLVFLISTR